MNNKLYFAAAESFNDPFEGRVAFSFGNTDDDKSDLSADQAGIQNFLCDAFRRKAGLCTLSEKRDDILMWSHYADSHKGICIEFEPQTSDQIKWFDNARPVRYQSNFPVNDYDKKPPTEADALAAMATKSTQWQYEHEWRLLREEPGLYDLPQGVISGVVLGCAISNEHRILVKEWAVLCSRPPLVYSASIRPREYALNITLVDS